LTDCAVPTGAPGATVRVMAPVPLAPPLLAVKVKLSLPW
jgi:hypothetical protein